MLKTNVDLSNQLALRSQDLDGLRSQASQAPDKALKGAAQQFEALFLNTLLKTMREASAGEGAFDSEQTKLYTSMLDQQFAQKLSERGIGLAEMMVKQLAQHLGAQNGAAPEATAGANANAASLQLDPLSTMRHPALPRRAGAAEGERSFTLAPAAAPAAKPAAAAARASAAESAPNHFVDRLLPHARAAAARLGVPERFLLGQAALESGWGKREPRFADGSTSHNLFGIKAGGNWQGKVVEVSTTEYVDGKRVTQKEKFRAYGSYAEAFADYARFLHTNPRYAHLLQGQHDAMSFAQGLQRAGYATDPNYADKLASVINGRTMRQAFA